MGCHVRVSVKRSDFNQAMLLSETTAMFLSEAKCSTSDITFRTQ